MEIAELIVASYEQGKPVTIPSMSWAEFLDLLSNLKVGVKKQ